MEDYKMFSIKPLNDNTKGFRFRTWNFAGLYRKRKTVSNWQVSQGETMTKIELGKRVIYLEHTKPRRILWNW